jgi:DNA modification methylase
VPTSQQATADSIIARDGSTAGKEVGVSGRCEMKPYYEHAGITIYHGDCLEVMSRLQEVDLVLTDPPYGVGYAEWDNSVPDMKWLDMARILSKLVILTPGNGSQYLYPKPDWTACWFRPGSVQRAANGGFSHWEPLLIYGKNPLPFDAKEFNPQTGQANSGHPCTKPLSVWKWIMSNCPGISVLDPYMGSGTTCVAAKDLGRNAVGIEIEEKYCEIAAKRLSQEVLQF